MTDQHSKPRKQAVNPAHIITRPEVFQFRHEVTYKHHVADVVKALKTSPNLDPLTIWQDPETGDLVLVDGHHRLEAYRRTGRKKAVPAVVHTCGLGEARLLALSENSKARRSLNHAERQDAAWRLVGMGKVTYSKSQIVAATGTSDGTVAKMRRVHAALIDNAGKTSLPDTWVEAMALHNDRDPREFTDDQRAAMIEARTAELDAKIGPELGHMTKLQLEAAAEVVAKRMGRQGLRYMFEHYGGDDDSWGTEEDLPF